MPDAHWAVGDVQGFLDPFRRVLRSIGVADHRDTWTGGDATLVVVGDLVDRGPDGVGVIELLMRLESEAPSTGGRVEVLVGNHDVLFLAAYLFDGEFLDHWRESGGVTRDLERLTPAHVTWLRQLPAMRRDMDAVLVHADALFYLEYGSTVDAVNAAFQAILAGDSVSDWRGLLEAFAEHRAFLGPEGCYRLDRMLSTYSAERLVHGHTPIPKVTAQSPESVTAAYVYCAGRAVNIDPGIYLGGPGFAYPF